MKTVVKVIVIILSWLFGKKQNNKKTQKSAITTDDPNRLKKVTELLKIRAQKKDEIDTYKIVLGKSQAISKEFKTYEEAEKWIKKVDNEIMELTMTIAKEIYDIEKAVQRREDIHKTEKTKKA